jgi:hypothetical protein
MAREDGFFDDLARGMANGSLTRGKALRLMGAAVVGGALGSLGIGEAGADPNGCKRNGKNCKRDDQCCSLNCSDGTCQEPIFGCLQNGSFCTTSTQCCSGTCHGQSCVCLPPDRIPCSGGPDGCPGGVGEGCTCGESIEGGSYCSVRRTATPCRTSCDCPAGQFCRLDGSELYCTVAATVCPVP